MKLTSLVLSGFRCFDHGGQKISIENFTCFVGPNASGKTAALMALVRLFGEHSAQREITPEDFHLGAGEKLTDKPQRKLTIECRLDFPELADAGTPPGDAVPETFNQMVVDAPGNPPFCRIRLEATWTATASLSGRSRAIPIMDSDRFQRPQSHRRSATHEKSSPPIADTFVSSTFLPPAILTSKSQSPLPRPSADF